MDGRDIFEGTTAELHAMESRFCLGDRVVLLVDNPDGQKHLLAGHTGYICKVYSVEEERNNMWRFGVSWDNFTDGHNCHGSCDGYSGWKVGAWQIMHEEEQEQFEFDEEDLNALFT